MYICRHFALKVDGILHLIKKIKNENKIYKPGKWQQW